MNYKNTVLMMMLVSSWVTSSAIAANVTGINTFSPGTPAVADEVNKNFEAVTSAVDDNFKRIQNLPGSGILSVTLSGTVGVLKGTAVVVGSPDVNNIATKFTTELKVGAVISILGKSHIVMTIIDNANLVLKTPHDTGATNATAFTDGDLLTLTDGAGQKKMVVNSLGGMTFSNGALPITPVKMRISVSAAVPLIVTFTEADNTVTTLTIQGNTARGTKIYYVSDSVPGNGGGASHLVFNINSSPSLSCTLLHRNDHLPSSPRIATDSGAGSIARNAWGNSTTKSFIISGLSGGLPLLPNSSYEIICF